MRHRYYLLLALFLLLAGAAISFAEPEGDSLPAPSVNPHAWGAITLFHGLPSNHVRAIAEDRDGVMWFGTDSGLARYDGRRIQKIAAEGPAANRVLALRFAPDGVLWIGTDSGAARLIDERFELIPETSGKAVTSIITPAEGRAVMASREGVIFDCSTIADGTLAVQTIEPKDHSLLRIDSGGGRPLPLTSLALIGETLIAGTRSRGLLAIERGEVKEILSHPRAFFVEAIEVDPHGRMWFGAQTTARDSGLFESGNLARPEKMGTDTGTITAIKFDSTGRMWIGTDEDGAFYYQQDRRQQNSVSLDRLEHFTFENTAGGMRSNHVYTVFVDREDVVWFGTDGGVCRYDPHGLRVELPGISAKSNFARALFQSSDGAMWCGTSSGLFVKSNPSSPWNPVEAFQDKVIHSIGEDLEGRLLVGTAWGLYVTNHSYEKRNTRLSELADSIIATDKRAFERVESNPPVASGGDSVRAVCIFQGVTYIASFGHGLERIDGSNRALVWPPDDDDERERRVVALHADGPARLWISTAEAGLFLFDGRQVQPAPAFDQLKGNTVWAIEGKSDDYLWLGTSRGLYALKAGELSAVIESNDIRSLALDDDDKASLWCASVGGGLFRVLIDKQGNQVIAQMDGEQGLPSENVFAVLTAPRQPHGRTLWIATSRGVVRYEPGQAAPPLKITRVMGKRVYQPEEIREGLSLEYPQNSLAIDVAATSSRTFPEQFQYSFSLLDASGKLIRQKLARDSQMLVENLRPGRYKIMAHAYTSDLVASEPLMLEFTVASAPFPWTTMALSVLLTLALIAVWWGSRQNRRLARTNDALAVANSQLGRTRMQLATETETERRRIARDLHDQTLADLRRLLLLTDELPAGKSTNGHKQITPAEFRGEIQSISNEIRRICEDLSPSVLANVGLAAALEWALADAVAHLPVERQFDYEFTSEDNLEERLKITPAVQIQIYRIVQEAVSNICRHSSARRVRLRIAIEPEGDFLLELEDDGGGFVPSSNATLTGRGLSNIRSRASLIEADVGWHKRPTGETLFTLRRKTSTVNSQSEDGVEMKRT